MIKSNHTELNFHLHPTVWRWINPATKDAPTK